MITCEGPSLSELYKTPRIRELIWQTLSSVFVEQFEKLIKKGEYIESGLVKKAKDNKFYLKELFIVYGFPLDSLEDLKDCLTFLKKEKECWNQVKDSHESE